MRGRGGGADLGASDFHQHDRFLGGAGYFQGFDELVRVLHAFHVAEHDAGAGVLRHVGEAVGELDIALVAHCGPEVQAEAPFACEREAVAAESARLRGDGNRAPLGPRVADGRDEGGDHAGAGIHHAHAIGAHDAEPALGAEIGQAALGARAVLGNLGETGGQHDGGLHALVDAGRQRRFHMRHRYDDHCHIDGARNIANGGKGRQALDLGSARVDRKYLAAIARDFHVVDRPTADLREVGRGTDDGHGLRIEERVESLDADAHAGFPPSGLEPGRRTLE